MIVSKVVLTLKVLIGVDVSTSRGYVCDGKCWMVVMNSMAVMTKQKPVVAPVKTMSSGSDGISVIR